MKLDSVEHQLDSYLDRFLVFVDSRHCFVHSGYLKSSEIYQRWSTDISITSAKEIVNVSHELTSPMYIILLRIHTKRRNPNSIKIKSLPLFAANISMYPANRMRVARCWIVEYILFHS